MVAVRIDGESLITDSKTGGGVADPRAAVAAGGASEADIVNFSGFADNWYFRTLYPEADFEQLDSAGYPV